MPVLELIELRSEEDHEVIRCWVGSMFSKQSILKLALQSPIRRKIVKKLAMLREKAGVLKPKSEDGENRNL
ncbi:hypothetical protein L1049_007145 [Liquidambar formosana]|uniref:Uncharacterized protein n=1 Tax=Liquidambar formosana TaxID=63359 RepID=A0AAP0WV21_LIQFO